jgi:hypothetical protein
MSATQRIEAMLESNGLRCGCAEKPIALCRELATELNALKAENERLLRGEYVCRECGVRKDHTHPKCDF